MIILTPKRLNLSNVNLDEKISCDAKYFLKKLFKLLTNKIPIFQINGSYCKDIRKISKLF